MAFREAGTDGVIHKKMSLQELGVATTAVQGKASVKVCLPKTAANVSLCLGRVPGFRVWDLGRAGESLLALSLG